MYSGSAKTGSGPSHGSGSTGSGGSGSTGSGGSGVGEKSFTITRITTSTPNDGYFYVNNTGTVSLTIMVVWNQNPTDYSTLPGETVEYNPSATVTPGDSTGVDIQGDVYALGSNFCVEVKYADGTTQRSGILTW